MRFETMCKPLHKPAWVSVCFFLALFAVGARAQTAGSADRQSRAQILQRVEAQAEAYKADIAKIPLQVRETERFYDGSGHLKRTRHSLYRFSFAALDSKTGQAGRRAAHAQAETPSGVDLADGASFPLLFLPGSVSRLSIRLETRSGGPTILHFRSTPCPPPILQHRWMQVDIHSQCVEGNAYLDPGSDSITRIRMKMGGLPVFFRPLPNPLSVEVFELYNEASFRLIRTTPGAPPQLVPTRSRYVTYTSRSRTVVDKTFEVLPLKSQGPRSH
jgi:hypothetical protein